MFTLLNELFCNRNRDYVEQPYPFITPIFPPYAYTQPPKKLSRYIIVTKQEFGVNQKISIKNITLLSIISTPQCIVYRVEGEEPIIQALIEEDFVTGFEKLV